MTVPTLLCSPFTASYERLSEVCPQLSVTELTDSGQPDAGQTASGGWMPAAGLAAGGRALDAYLDWDDAQVRRDYGQQARPDVIASFGFHRYAWPACLLITVPWFLHRRVPRLPVDAVAFRRSRGRLAVRISGFGCLPGDPAAALPGARVVPDEDALRAEVRAAVAEHLGPVLEGFGPRMRRGRRALWGMATDEIVEGLWYFARLLGEEQRGMAELDQLLPGSTAPFVGTAGFRELAGPQGRPLPGRERASCCLFYTLRPEDTCVACPRTCDADRIAGLTAGIPLSTD
jgi:hypothetical protein